MIFFHNYITEESMPGKGHPYAPPRIEYGDRKDVMYVCGIAGMIGPEPSEETIRRMKATMERRGPDGFGCYRHGDATLLHSRLAIIDPAGGAQPMALEFSDERYVLVYNGELYNTEEIRQELTKLGHRFLGHSDTEVVLHA